MTTKLSVEKVINKSFLVWGIPYNKTSVETFYKWTLDDETYERMQYSDEFVLVDFDKRKMEWYIIYFNYNMVQSCTIDDVSGSYAITSMRSN